ncbi:MAG: hypothetical protein M1269_03155, partial [Chloroflexi bacterium]|nr:hypothetical protein [Chloroflexota bacterium]
MAELPRCIHTGVGSMPDKEAAAAVDLIIEKVPCAPFWPQLAARDFREEMYYQYSEGFPCWILDAENKKGYFVDNDQLYDELAVFYEQFMNDTPADLPVSGEYAAGLTEFLSNRPR